MRPGQLDAFDALGQRGQHQLAFQPRHHLTDTAECGGSAMCATCHVYVDPVWADRLPAPQANELELLDCTATERLPTSRLSCQIKLTAALQGLVLRIPERQQ